MSSSDTGKPSLVTAPDLHQAPVLTHPPVVLTVAIGSLALGGAEFIVLNWAASTVARFQVRLLVLRNAEHEWSAPQGIDIVRFNGNDIVARLEAEARRLTREANRTVLCHLLKASERLALTRGGAIPVPVIHNARAGWLEPGEQVAVESPPFVIAVSEAAAKEIRDLSPAMPCIVVRHLPHTRKIGVEMRALWRQRWALPQQAKVIGMTGGVKPQKSYPRALRILAALHGQTTLDKPYLVILGGPTGRDGLVAWSAVLAQVRRLGLDGYIRLPGFLPDAARCLPAFDLLLNTSRYEGLSIATLEALVAGLPVIASRVGGQGEVLAPGLTLINLDEPDTTWAHAVSSQICTMPELPDWINFPSHRLWTLCHLAQRSASGRQVETDVLFVTANLNAGGAQRSLVNLALNLNGRLSFEVVVCGQSSSSYFVRQLQAAGINLHRSADSRDAFDHAEALVRHVSIMRPGIVCFWNVDPKIKLLLLKVLTHHSLRFVDVCPGAYAFEEMQATASFQTRIAFSATAYYARLTRLVMKYQATRAELADAPCPVTVIPNGVPIPSPANPIDTTEVRGIRVVMSGRIAPSKYLREALTAVELLWDEFPTLELHVMGVAEPRHAAYAESIVRQAGHNLDKRLFLHGAHFDAPDRLVDFDLAVVLGEHQGCPNSVLEAMAAGIAVVANDSGGTRELVLDGRTGVLLSERTPESIAAGLRRLITAPELAKLLAAKGQDHVKRRFSMDAMTKAYMALFKSVIKEASR